MSITKGQIPDFPEVAAKKELMLKCLANNYGIVLRAIESKEGKKLRLNYGAHRNWMIGDPIYRKKVEDMIELKRDFVEKHFQELVDQHEPSCVNHAARYLLRKRGYEVTERLEVGSLDGDPLKLEVRLPENLVAEALKKVREIK